MRCPACNSTNTKSAKLIWESSVRIGRYETVSEFAVRFAPPQRRQWFDSYDPIFLGGLLVAWSIYIIGLGIKSGERGRGLDYLADDPYFLPITWTTIALIVVLRVIRIVRSIHYNRDQYPLDKEQWARTWGCMRCGRDFLVDSASDTRVKGR